MNDGLTKMRNRWILGLMTVLALAGCRNAEPQMPDSAVKTVHFRAVAGSETRTAFGELENGRYPTRWTDADSAVLLSLNYEKAEEAAVAPSQDGRTASFAAGFDASATASPYTFYAVSPASAARAISPSRKAWSVSVAAEQTPLANSVDEAAQLLVAKSASATALPDEAELHFSHLTAYGRIALKNLALGDAEVRKVELVFGTPVVGEWYWHEDGTVESNGASHTIVLHASSVDDLWFACAPTDVSGSTLNVRVVTSEGVFSKKITFAEGRSFASGKVARFSVDMAGIEMEGFAAGFYQVRDASLLREGDEILIVDEDVSKALGAQNSSALSPYRYAESVVAENGVITRPSGAYVLTLEAADGEGRWLLADGNGYLCSTSNRNSLTTTQDAASGNAWWDVSIDGDGIATVEALEGGSRLIRYNAGTLRFTCYKDASSSQTRNVRIFRKREATVPDGEDPLTAREEYGCYITDFERVYVKGADQYSRSVRDDGTVVFTLLNAAEKEQMVISGFDPALAKGDAATVSVHYKKGRKVLLNKSFALEVVREDGPKVWLGDGTGQGFIIKK